VKCDQRTAALSFLPNSRASNILSDRRAPPVSVKFKQTRVRREYDSVTVANTSIHIGKALNSAILEIEQSADNAAVNYCCQQRDKTI